MIAAMREPAEFDRGRYDAVLEEHGIAEVALAEAAREREHAAAPAAAGDPA